MKYFTSGVADDRTMDAIEDVIISWDEYPDVLFHVPQTTREMEDLYGEIQFTDGNSKWGTGLGWITITNDWKNEYVKRVVLPVVGVQYVNKIVEPSLRAVLELIEERGLGGNVRTCACWAPRHKMHDPARGLSTHSWAAAVDINASTNGVGSVGDLDSGIVSAFESLSWVWGGRWRPSDPMHFQLAGPAC